MPGAIATNLHQGSRSEYLAQYVFAAFGTAVATPHQGDYGLDLYCTLLEQQGNRGWPKGYFSVQVKSTREGWIFDNENAVRWLVEYPYRSFFAWSTKPLLE
jgi:hypothetical protein